MSVNAIDAEISKRVLYFIRKQEVTQPELAECLELTQAAISRKLNGSRYFTASELYQVACLLRLSPARFFPGPVR